MKVQIQVIIFSSDSGSENSVNNYVLMTLKNKDYDDEIEIQNEKTGQITAQEPVFGPQGIVKDTNDICIGHVQTIFQS